MDHNTEEILTKGALTTMSTTQVTPSGGTAIANNAQNEQPTTKRNYNSNTERFDVAFGYLITQKDGKEVKEATVITKMAEAEQLSDTNEFVGTTTTVTCDYPATFPDLVKFAQQPWFDTDDSGKKVQRKQEDVEAEIVKLFKNGANSKVMNRLRAVLTKTDDKGNFEYNDSLLDLTDEITSGSKRVFLSEEQKMWKSIAFLPKDARKESVWRAYLTSLGKDFYWPEE
jgi:hypothetical protein